MKGQTLIEYIIIVGVALMAIYVMAPAIKRGTQSVVKATADQLAPQQNAEQDFVDSSYMERQTAKTDAKINRRQEETNAAIVSIVNEETRTRTETVTNQGFSPQ